MPGMTKTKLLKFIKARNESSFSSNLQFSIDATEAGFDVNELGDAVKREGGGYEWNTRYGHLIEEPSGHVRLIQPTENINR